MSNAPSVPDDLATLAFESSRDSLRQQAALLDELRGRAGTLLTASSIVASFLGSQVLKSGNAGYLSLAAVGCFVVSIVGCLWILLPHEGVIFAISGSTLYTEQYGQPIEETHRLLAYWLEDFQRANKRVIDRLFNAYRVAGAAVVAQTVIWALHFA